MAGPEAAQHLLGDTAEQVLRSLRVAVMLAPPV